MIESTEDQSTLICRGCLKEWGEMKNMYEWGLDVDFFRYTDISRDPSEGLPVLLCSDCEADLKKTKEFTDRCRQSNQILKRNLKIVSNGDGKTSKNNVSSLLMNNKLLLMINAPNPEDKINLPCPFDCNAEFLKNILLSNHLKNTHNVPKNFEIEQQYYCSVDGCIYNINSTPKKYFSGRKYLNQHYNKTHKDKIYYCDNCKMKFSLESNLHRHSRTCNFIYTCPVCKIQYKTNESYLVHLKRRHPNIHTKLKLDKIAAKIITVIDKSNSKETTNNISLKRKSSNTDYNNINEQDHAKRSVNKMVKILPRNNQTLQTVQIPEFGIPIDEATTNTQMDSNSHFNDQTIDLNISINGEVIAEENIPGNANETIVEINKEKSFPENVNDGEINANRMGEQSRSPWFVEQYIVQEYQGNTQGLKKSSATQIPSYETLNSWTNKTDFEMQTDGIATQTVLDEILSLKPHNGDDEVFFPESVSDIETQTFPFEFPLNRCNKETQSLAPDLSFKETQTCVCFCPSSKPNCRHFGCLNSSQNNFSVISTETQTGDSRRLINSDVMLSFSSAETQTCFEDSNDIS